jgi:surface protein
VTATYASRPRLSNSRSLRSAAAQSWVRPAAWLSVPDVTGLQRFAGLHRIDVDGNLVALTAAGAYTVDWGDGTTTNHTSGSTAEKTYSYSSISSTGESALGYRQVIIQVYPQSGQNLTTLNLNVRNTTSSVAYSSGWLEVVVNGSNLTSLVFSGNTTAARLLQQATVLQHNLTSTNSMFLNCTALVSVPLFNTASVTITLAMFQNCVSLKSVPLFNTAAVTNMGSMFHTCSSLTEVPLFNTAAATNMASMFNTCQALRSVPLFNTGAVTNMGSMFNACINLTTVPLFNAGAVTSMTNMFSNCSSLASVPPLNTAVVTTMTSMFSACLALTGVPLFNTASVTNVSGAFNGCLSLTTLPALNLSAVSSAANMATFVATGTPISSCACTGINQTVSFANCKLSAAQIDAIFTNLSSTGTGKTITVTGNYGAATCTQSIATAKGWTVAV